MDGSVQTAPMLVPFGKYLLDAEIAKGGMARVYLARLRGLGGFEKKLVVKQILPELASDPRFVQMFVDEAKTLVQMSHPHIVPVYELGIVDGVYFLAMEHIEGSTLADILKRGPLAPELVAHLGIQVCDALQYAHDRFNLVHRDVTPRNIIVDNQGHCRLLDFGIAAPAEGAEEKGIFGSHGYMSPEQAVGDPVDPRSDLFSLGAVLYEALAGKAAFLRESAEASNRALLAGAAPRLRELSEIPAPLASEIDRALALDPATRQSSAAALGRKLRGWLAGAHPEGVAPELGARAGRARSKISADARTASAPQPGAETLEHTPKHVSTIATSVTLLNLLDKEAVDPPTQSDGAERIDPEGDKQGGTVPIAGRGERMRVSGEKASRARVAGALAGVLAVGVVGILWATSSDEVAETQDGSGISRGDPHKATVEPAHRPARDPITTEVKTIATPDAGIARGVQQTETPPAILAKARITVNATPWADVTIDGRRIGITPKRQIEVSAGQHVLIFECPPLGRSQRVPIRTPSGSHVSILVDLNQDPPAVTTLP